MLHPLEEKIVALRRRARRTATVHGLSLMAASLVAAAIAVGLIDYLVRLEDRGLRIIGSLVVLGALGWAAYRFLRPVFFTRFGDVELARRVGCAFPKLQRGLQSAVEFLGQAEDDLTAGSAALRRLVIAQTEADVQGIDFCDAIDHRPARRAVAVLVAACALAAALVVLSPASARIAAVRLVNPLGNTTWPRATNLALRHPVARIVRGGAFQVEVVDEHGAQLPRNVRIYYRTRATDGAMIEESERMRFVDGAMVARWETVSEPFLYRVEGGDDRSMPWRDVEVIDPPAVESLAIRMSPPTYTGLPAAESPRHVRAIVDTRLEMVGQATKPLRSAGLCLEGGRRIAATLGEDGRTFTVGPQQLAVEKSGAYWFELVDREGFRGGGEDRWEITAVEDSRPAVTIERPAANVVVTPQAVAPVRISARDDLALREVGLVFRTSASGTDRRVVLWKSEGGPHPGPLPKGEGTAADRRTVNYRWGLESLGLKPGSEVIFHATASDYGPQVGESEPRRLTVVTPEQLLDRLSAREKLIASELERALVMQRTCRGQVDALRFRLSAGARFERVDVDQLEAAEHAEQDVAQLLSSRSNGLPASISALLGDLENNRIAGGDFQRRMVGLLTELERLARNELPTIGRRLTAARKTVEANREAKRLSPEPNRTGRLLVAAVAEQDAVIGMMEQWLSRLARWDSYGRCQREVAQLLREQEELTRRTAEVGRRTLGADLHDLSPSDFAELKTVAGAELELARRLDRTLQEVEEANAQLRSADPVAADTIADAVDMARRLAIGSAIRTAGAAVEQNQIGQAAAGGKQIAEGLQEVLDILANRQAEAARLVKKLRQVESELAELESSQRAVTKQIESAARSQAAVEKEAARRQLQRLAGDQQQLREETERLARQLERLQSQRAATAMNRVAEHMAQAGRSAAEGKGSEAQGAAGRAEQSLADVRRELAERVRQAAAELAFEQTARLDDAVKHLCRQQEGALEESRRLWNIERRQGNLSRAQAAAVVDLTRLQRALGDETVCLAKQLAGAAVIQVAMDEARREMRAAAESLDRRQTGPPTQGPQQRAFRQLTLVVEAIKPEPTAAKSNEGDSGAGGQQNRQPTVPQSSIPPIAELKLLKLLQTEINADVERLRVEVKAAGGPTEEQTQRYRELSRRQGRLAEIIERAVRQEGSTSGGGPRGKLDGNGEQRSFAALRMTARLMTGWSMIVWSASPTEEELRRELGAAAEKEDEEPMSRIAQRMRDLERRIGRGDVGEATQKVERQVVGDLDRLIEQSRQKQGKCQGGTCQSKPGGKSDSPNQNKPGAAEKPGGKPAAGATAKSSSKGGGKAGSGQARATMKQLWGELPERGRQQMLQLPDEEFPPKYRAQIEDYFRRLAEERTKDK